MHFFCTNPEIICDSILQIINDEQLKCEMFINTDLFAFAAKNKNSLAFDSN